MFELSPFLQGGIFSSFISDSFSLYLSLFLQTKSRQSFNWFFLANLTKIVHRLDKKASLIVTTFFVSLVLIKVSKFQKHLFLLSFEPKNERNYFLNSKLACKMGRIKKMKALYYVIRCIKYSRYLFFNLNYSR